MVWFFFQGDVQLWGITNSIAFSTFVFFLLTHSPLTCRHPLWVTPMERPILFIIHVFSFFWYSNSTSVAFKLNILFQTNLCFQAVLFMNADTYKLSGCGFDSRCSHISHLFRKEFINMQATILCRFNLKCVSDMIKIHNQIHHADKYLPYSSIIWSVLLIG